MVLALLAPLASGRSAFPARLRPPSHAVFPRRSSLRSSLLSPDGAAAFDSRGGSRFLVASLPCSPRSSVSLASSGAEGPYGVRSLVAYLEHRCQFALLDGVKALCPGNFICSWRISR